MNKQEDLYAYFYYEWCDKGLKPVELLIVMKIHSYINNGKTCYMTNKQFADLFNVSEKTISNTLDKLEKKGFIKRVVDERTNHRTIKLNDKVKHIRKNTQVKENTKQNKLNNDFSF